MQMLVDVKEINDLKELRDLMKEFLERADKENLYVGLGYDADMSRPQEGPRVTRMREIVLPGTKAI